MINSKITEVPVLLLIFNRPDTVGKVIDALREIKPRHLYVAADGARATRPEERTKTEAARKMATAIDWPCEVSTLFREENLGCYRAVSGAIDWFFENVEEGIILEDDCVPDPSYFRFANELLERYRDDERVMTIGASHFHGAAHQPPYSYFFSRNSHCWGWASWRRAWKLYDREMSFWPELRETDWLLGVGNGSRAFQRYWTEIFDRVHAGKIDSWAYRWTFSCWAQNGLSILPSKNLVRNIGFEHDATHTAGSGHLELALEQMVFPLVHPPCMVRDVEADAWSDRYLFSIDQRRSIRGIVKRLLGFVLPRQK
ncbi:glycosyltransferase family 2 protein [Ferrigenium sp. UT5]|uniref:glycosyltransferase family 2 protein n=1 Tax=Ferrigenium sp. UT5 TaxID=3242105 RepID=UPI0038B27975